VKARWTLPALVVLLLVTTGSSCSNSRTGPEFVRETGIRLVPQGFWPLEAGQGFYELWLGTPAVEPAAGQNPWEIEQDWVAAASFRVGGDGRVYDLAGTLRDFHPLPSSVDAARIARGVVTYQPSSDAGGPHPMGMFLAIGDFTAPGETITSDLSWDDDEVFPRDLRPLSGHFRLRSVTAEGGAGLPRGVWFFDPGPTDQPSLQLAEPLPTGWTFEAWAFQRDPIGSLLPLQIHRLGRFLHASGADSDGAGPYALPGGAAPAFPGQDFVQDVVLDLDDGSWSVMITIEPLDDPMPLVPTSLRILERGILQTDGIDVPIELTNRAQRDQLPRCAVTVVR